VRRPVLAAAVGALAVVLAGCGGSATRHLDAASVAAAIRRSIVAQGGTIRSVTCPAGQVARSGTQFDCRVVLLSGEREVALVVVTDSSGHFAYSTYPAR
jgi:hypothetical protein